MKSKRAELKSRTVTPDTCRVRQSHTIWAKRGVAWLLVLVFIAQACSAAPPVFARLDLNQSQTYRNMTVSSLETVDIMNLSISRVTLHSTTGDWTDTKNLTLPSIHEIRRIFYPKDNATWNGNTLTVMDADSTVSGSGFKDFTLFIQKKIPVIQCQVNEAQGDIFLSRIEGSNVPANLSQFLTNTDRLYILRTFGGVGLEILPNGTVGKNTFINVSLSDFNQTDMGYTLLKNENLLDNFILDRIIAQQLSASNNPPPLSGEYLLSGFQYTPPPTGKITTYAAWPVIILDGDNRLTLVGKTHPYLYNKRTGGDLSLTFENTAHIHNLSYVFIKEAETYDADVRVNMTALEECGGAVSLDLILSGNPFLSILKDLGLGQSDLKKVVSYSIKAVGNSTPPHSSHFSKINITPGYGTSGYALHASQVTIPFDDLQGLLSGNFSIYALGADVNNTVVALDQDRISIGNSPLADFNASPTTGPAPLPVQFTDLSSDSPTAWNWTFGDGGISAAQDPSHTYTVPGLYNVTLTASNAFGSGTERKDFYINVTSYLPPDADFFATPTTGPAPLAVQFTDNSTGTITSRAWTFGDGGTSTGVNPSHTYLSAGTYTVSLNVTGPGGSDTETKTGYITVSPPALQADFYGTPTAGFVPHFVQFTDTSTGPHDTWNWDFGDGGTSTAQNPGHTYTSTGTYTVSLSVRMGSGTPSVKTRTNYITVFAVPPPPVAQFTANVTTGDAPLPVQFTDLSSGSPYEWNWSFGDGGSSTDRNPLHTYASPGNYTVSLTVRGLGGFDTETKANYIHVLAHPPVADFVANVTAGDAPLPVQFTDLSSGDPTSWSWTFGDGNTSLLQNPVHVYHHGGNYTVALTAANAYGGNTITKEGYIHVLPPVLRADFIGAPTEGYAPLLVSFSDLSKGDPLSWNWSFGDGSISTAVNPVHSYNTAGTYSVSLTISNGTANDILVRNNYITVRHRGGGGGGGGGSGGTFFVTASPTPYVTITVTPTPTQIYEKTLPLGPENRTSQPVMVGSYDGIATISIGIGVAVTGANGTPLADISIFPVNPGDLSNLPVDPAFTGYPYLVSPEEAQFDPEVLLTLSFTPEEWAALSGRDLVLMRYDPGSGSWVPLPTSVDAAGRTVITGISHGGTYGLFARQPATPTQTVVPVTTAVPEEVPLPWTLILIIVVVVIIGAGVAVYFLKVRPGAREPPGKDEIT